MDKKKQQKQKERERRVAKEKLVTIEKRRAQAKAEAETSGSKPATRSTRVITSAIPKVDNRNIGGAKPQVTHRRAGS